MSNSILSSPAGFSKQPDLEDYPLISDPPPYRESCQNPIMSEPTFGQRCIATIQAELEIMTDAQLEIGANIIDREHAHSKGRLDTFALEHPSPVRRGSRKIRAELFDSLCGSCGLTVDGMTVPMKRSISVALNAIMEVSPELTTIEILGRAVQYRRKHPTWELTPNSLAKYWGSCATQESMKGLLDEPRGWRGYHAQIFPPDLNGSTGEMMSQNPWERIGRPHQNKIVRWMSQRDKPEPTVRLPYSED